MAVIVAAGNRMVMREHGGFSENGSTGERIPLRESRGPRVFDIVRCHQWELSR